MNCPVYGNSLVKLFALLVPLTALQGCVQMTWCDQAGAQHFLVIGASYLVAENPIDDQVQVSHVKALGIMAQTGGAPTRASVGYVSQQLVRVPLNGDPNIALEAVSDSDGLQVQARTFETESVSDPEPANNSKKRQSNESRKQSWVYFGGCNRNSNVVGGMRTLTR